MANIEKATWERRNLIATNHGDTNSEINFNFVVGAFKATFQFW